MKYLAILLLCAAAYGQPASPTECPALGFSQDFTPLRTVDPQGIVHSTLCIAPSANVYATSFFQANSTISGPIYTPEEFSTGIQGAINAVATTGGTVSLCSTGIKTYNVSTLLTITNSYFRMIGLTARGCVINWTGASSSDVMDIGPSSGGPIIYLFFYGFSITRNGVAGTANSANMFFQHVNTADVDTVESSDATYDYRAIASPTTIANIRFYRCQALATVAPAVTEYGWWGFNTSSRIVDSNAAPFGNNLNYGVYIPTGTTDLFIQRFTCAAGPVTACINATGTIEDISISTLACDTNTTCLNFVNVSGGTTMPNTVRVYDSYLNDLSTSSIAMINISGSEGIQIIGGQCTPGNLGNCVLIQSASKNNFVSGMRIHCVAGTNTDIPIVISGSTFNTVEFNQITGRSGAPCNIGIDVISTSTNNVIIGNICGQSMTTCISFDATSGPNAVFGNDVNTAAITNKILDGNGNNGKNYQMSGSCTMAAGTCTAVTLPYSLDAAPVCQVTWTGGGALAGSLKVASTTTTVTPSSSNGADTAVVNWKCEGN